MRGDYCTGFEFRQHDVRATLLESDSNLHSDTRFIGRAANYVGEHPRPLIEFDQRKRIGRLDGVGGIQRPVSARKMLYAQHAAFLTSSSRKKGANSEPPVE
jgi:hypothetical protein